MALTEEQIGLLVERLPHVTSLRDLARELGTRLDTVRFAAAPFLALMKAQGTHPQCGCGRDRFHPYGCVDARTKVPIGSNPFPGHRPEDRAFLLQRRELAVQMLADGARLVDVDQALGMNKCARAYLRFLTPEQTERRERAIAWRSQEGTNVG